MKHKNPFLGTGSFRTALLLQTDYMNLETSFRYARLGENVFEDTY